MKKTEIATRKHGLKARLAASVTGTGERLRTELCFQRDSNVYVWTTDRGRSRFLIKH